MKIKLQLRDIVKNDAAREELGISPYCLNEGGDGDEWIETTAEDAIRWGVIRPIREE